MTRTFVPQRSLARARGREEGLVIFRMAYADGTTRWWELTARRPRHASVDTLRQQDRRGVHIVLDEFGAGSCSRDLPVLAFGVETVGQLEILTDLGCDQVQGFLAGDIDPASLCRTVTGGLLPANDHRGT
jgi:predicted signal transduction protein with EAL and GGDEF domain